MAAPPRDLSKGDEKVAAAAAAAAGTGIAEKPAETAPDDAAAAAAAAAAARLPRTAGAGIADKVGEADRGDKGSECDGLYSDAPWGEAAAAAAAGRYEGEPDDM